MAKNNGYNIKITKDKYAHIFGGAGFHNNDASLYHITDKEKFNQYICKCYREISPGFMRSFLGFSDWSKEAMDEFCEYYHKMQHWTDTPMYFTPANGRVHFSDEEMQQYCEDVAERIAYLYFEKNVKHIRYYCFANEMSCGMWGVLLEDLPRFRKYHEFLFRAFAKRKLPVGLLATDATGYESWSSLDWVEENMSDITEDYCVHIYEQEHDIYDLKFYDFFKEKCEERVTKAINNFGKRVILGEIGIQKADGEHLLPNKNVIIDVCRYFDDEYEERYCGLMVAEMIFAAINAGIYALAYWSYIDHPDPFSCAYSTGDDYSVKWGEAERYFSCTTDSKYNKWGVLKWEDDGKCPVRSIYWCIAPIMKLFKKNSKVLNIETDNDMLRCAGIYNRDESVSIGIVNRAKENVKITLDSGLFNKTVRVYEYDSNNVDKNNFGDMQDCCALLEKGKCEYVLKPDSVTFFTTDYIEKCNHVIAPSVRIENDTLCWNEVESAEHCYYRVYASAEKNVSICRENQVASTVECSLPIKNKELNYTVLSVDKSGNV